MQICLSELSTDIIRNGIESGRIYTVHNMWQRLWQHWSCHKERAHIRLNRYEEAAEWLHKLCHFCNFFTLFTSDLLLAEESYKILNLDYE